MIVVVVVVAVVAVVVVVVVAVVVVVVGHGWSWLLLNCCFHVCCTMRVKDLANFLFGLMASKMGLLAQNLGAPCGCNFNTPRRPPF